MKTTLRQRLKACWYVIRGRAVFFGAEVGIRDNEVLWFMEYERGDPRAINSALLTIVTEGFDIRVVSPSERKQLETQ